MIGTAANNHIYFLMVLTDRRKEMQRSHEHTSVGRRVGMTTLIAAVKETTSCYLKCKIPKKETTQKLYKS